MVRRAHAPVAPRGDLRARQSRSVKRYDRASRTAWASHAIRGNAVLGYVSETNLRLQSPQLAQAQQAQNGPMCRVFDQTFQARGGQPEIQRYRACRDAQGQWVVQA